MTTYGKLALGTRSLGSFGATGAYAAFLITWLGKQNTVTWGGKPQIEAALGIFLALVAFALSWAQFAKNGENAAAVGVATFAIPSAVIGWISTFWFWAYHGQTNIGTYAQSFNVVCIWWIVVLVLYSALMVPLTFLATEDL